MDLLGPSAHPLFNALTQTLPTPNGYGRITLNYEKFLLDSTGKPVRRYPRKFSVYVDGELCTHRGMCRRNALRPGGGYNTFSTLDMYSYVYCLKLTTLIPPRSTYATASTPSTPHQHQHPINRYDMEADIKALLNDEPLPEPTEAYLKAWREAKREAVKSEYVIVRGLMCSFLED